MKIKNIIRLVALAVAGASVSSCEDTLDVNRTDVLSDAAIWSTLEAADAYITASYKIFTDDVQLKGSRSHFWDSFSDISKSSSWDQYGHPYNSFLLQGLTTGENGAGPFECWNTQYNRIRTANVCLRSLREFGGKFGEDAVKVREAEIRMCRAYSYFMLARVYGGVVLRTETSGANGLSDGAIESDIPMARASEEDTYKFIIGELTFAAENLPDENSAQWLRGRATKKVAYGLLSRIALFAKNWAVAADAAEKCGAAKGVDLDPSFAHLLSTDAISSPEVLFAIEYLKGNANLYHLWDNFISPAGDASINGGGAYGEHQPTAELADLYEWSDGTAFSWSDWSTDHADPFTDREPRFQATILYNGASWRGRTIEAYEGGVEGYKEFVKTGSTGGKTCTGYFFRKYAQEDNLNFIEAGDRSWVPDPILRYGEVLLNQAEAYAQLDYVANREKALECVNKIRTRVNLPEKTIADVPSLEAFMKLIRDERAKELVCDGFRFWDLRRWGLAQGTIGGQMMHGVKIKPSGSAYTYEVVDCDAGVTRVYPERYDYFSIPLSERSNNKLCTNNPGW